MTITPDGPLAEEPEAQPDTSDDLVLREARSVLEQAAPQLGWSMDLLDTARRIVFVHAHPDDETINNGATIAKYAAQGVHVTVVTCTLGEQGEVIAPELEHLGAGRDDALGPHRLGELATAMEALGVRDFRLLGGPGRYRDSGMMGDPANDRRDCFWWAHVDEAAGHVVEVIREVRPQVVVTYDDNGGYGHPDHIQAHRVTMRAVALAGSGSYGTGEPWDVAKVYSVVLPKSWWRESLRALRTAGAATTFEAMDPDGELPMGVDDDVVTTVVDAQEYVEAKLAAMRAHATQITVDGPFFALSSNLGDEARGREAYVLVRGELGPEATRDPTGRETDLFAGLE